VAESQTSFGNWGTTLTQLLEKEPEPKYFPCFNGPVQGTSVQAPSDATPGTACALPWKAVDGSMLYAVYVLVDYNGHQGLMFLQNYVRPEYAQAKVERLTAILAAGVS
jgi:hypothetical protein